MGLPWGGRGRLALNQWGDDLERNRIEFRPNRFRGLMPDGDWHMRLATALALAKSLTASRELFDAIEGLELQLSKNDECVHTVTVSARV